MTVIAYDLRFVSMDSRVTINDCIVSDDYNKSTESAQGVYFFSGKSACRDRIISLFESEQNIKEKFNFSMYYYEKSTKKLFYICADGFKLESIEVTYTDAIGSGCDHAITAIDCGLSAEDAVAMTIKRDSKCGGRIRVFDTVLGVFVK